MRQKFSNRTSILYRKSLSFFVLLVRKAIRLKNKDHQGMTLLEALVALSLFAFMFVFITRTLQQSHRQAKKIKQDIRWTSSLSHVLDLIRQDFQGVGYLLDINQNLNIRFPIEKDKDQPVSIGGESVQSRSSPQQGLKKNQDTNKTAVSPVFLSPYFVFDGKDDEIHFVSYSFSHLALNPSSAQWIKIRYSVQNCNNIEKDDPGFCLIRSANKYWELEEKEEPEETLILLRGLSSLEFSYSGTEDFLARVWKEEWKWEYSLFSQNVDLEKLQTLPFPAVVKMEMEKEERKQIFFFPVSHSYLRSWNPYDKTYPGFPRWLPPKKNRNRIPK